MSVPPEIAGLVQQWLRKAGNDLTNAKHTLLIAEDCPYDTVCFHAQQCVEKCLKAILVCSQTPFHKTHDLEELSLLLPSSFVIPLSVEELARLTPHATNSRYPDDWRSPERSEAEWALATAERIMQAAKSWLSSPPRMIYF